MASRSRSNLCENGVHHTVTLKPVFRNPDGTDALDDRRAVRYQTEYSEDASCRFRTHLHESLVQNGKNASLIVEFLRGIVERRMSAKNLSGPDRHRAICDPRRRRRARARFCMLMSVVSLNLAIFNLLPIPILDGGVILTLLIEMVMGRDLSLNVKEAMLKVGFVFLMMLVVFVIYNDIAKRFTPAFFSRGRFTSVPLHI